MPSDRDALEAALVANPDDPVCHAVYADYLTEAGDPRGDYIRLQLALEDRDQPLDRLRAMEQRAAELRRQHELEWLGPLVLVEMTGDLRVTWHRGWVTAARLRWDGPGAFIALAALPAARLLRQLTVVDLIGDAGVEELASSGLIGRLRGLDLSRCDITDEGAQRLADTPAVAGLEYLHLDGNLLSPIGIEALAAVGVTVSPRQLYGGYEIDYDPGIEDRLV